MGWKYEVNLWVNNRHGDGWHYRQGYAGDNFFMAAWYAISARINGTKCIQVVWR